MKQCRDQIAARPSRNHEQSMGLWINEPILRNPGAIDESIHTLADSGFGIVRIFLRNSNFTHRSPEVLQIVERVVLKSHSLGLRAVLDCEPHHLACSDMGREYPEAMGCLLVHSTSPVTDGHWLLRTVNPALGGATANFDGLAAAWLESPGGTERISLDYSTRAEKHHYRNGGIHREMNYAEGVSASTRKMIELRGEFPGLGTGRVSALLRFRSRLWPDFWAEGFHRYFERLLEAYRHIPLDGVGWDEPAIDGDWKTFRYGEAFAAAFEKINGYSLEEYLPFLDTVGDSGEAVKVHLDYYRTLNEGLARAQERLNAKAEELFGAGLLSGTHHTWQGEGGINDLRAGAVDYFRLNDGMDAGYTDCSWWDPAAVAYAYTLGSSLGRLTPSGEAEVNSWHYKPTFSNIRRNVNLMSLMNINWFNIWFGSDSDCILQEGHYTWPQTVRAMRAHQELQRAIGRKSPVVQVAIWHGWEGVCAWNRPGLANAQKAFCLNTSKLFIDQSLAVDFVDSRLLAESRIGDGSLVNRLGSYRVLVVPYALAMPRDAFNVCVAFAKAGGRLIFVGTPVAFDESGNFLSSEFAALFNMPAMNPVHYMEGLEVECDLPEFRPQRLEVCRQLSSDLPNKLVSIEDEVHGVKLGNAVFLTDLDPQHRLIEQMSDVLDKSVRGFGRNFLWRHYRDESGEGVMIVSSDEAPLAGILFWGSDHLEITGGFSGFFTRSSLGKISQTGDLSWQVVSCAARGGDS